MKKTISSGTIVPVVAAIIFDTRKNVLIARRKPHLRNGGLWEFPGGKILPGESPQAALQREIREEMGVTISVDRLFDAVTFAYPRLNILLLAYICHLQDDDWVLRDHDGMAWVPPSELDQYLLSPADIEIIKTLRKQFPAL